MRVIIVVAITVIYLLSIFLTMPFVKSKNNNNKKSSFVAPGCMAVALCFDTNSYCVRKEKLESLLSKMVRRTNVNYVF